MNPIPTPEQRAWQEAELSLFLHFGMNTFTNREWGDGTENPRQFRPAALDARQWVKTAKAAGFRYLILTAKHHDGFCLWPSRHTAHSVKNSPWKNGNGDVVREFTQACRAENVKAGLYLSPWDRNAPMYGDSPAYNQFYLAQLTELLTDYGPIAEVWFDGANGEGPNGKKQEYDWAAYYQTIRRLQPHALIAVNGPDIRWVGNEDGVAHETEWSVQPPDPTFHPNTNKPVWWPAECDTSIRPGWFWHAAEDSKVKSLDTLLDIYFQSVGRNSVLLLNVPPNDQGLLPDPDVRRLRQFRAALDRQFQTDICVKRPANATSESVRAPARALTDGDPETFWSPSSDDPTPSVTVDLGSPVTFALARLREQIAEGQHIEVYRLEAEGGQGWHEIMRGTTIGHQKIDRFPPVTARRVRLTIEKSRDQPRLRRLSLYAPPPGA